jgi:hypothetical protein
MVELERKMMEYTISQTEITRRRKAYITLSMSIVVGLVIASILFNFPVAIGGYALVITALFLLGTFSFGFFRTLLKTKIILSKMSLERIVNGFLEKYALRDIDHVTVKWTTNSTIREIYIYLRDGRSIFISALEQFEEFKEVLVRNLDAGVMIKEIHEPLDFDHPLFYTLLGFPISIAGVFVFTSIPLIGYQQTRIGVSLFVVFLCIFGTYFIIAKPISKRSGNTTVVSDYGLGFLMIASAIGIAFLYFGR